MKETREKEIKLNPKDFETPKGELERHPEYIHLLKLCAELKLSL